MKPKIKLSRHEERILSQVPPNYYQRGIKKNKLQRAWHKGKLNVVLSLIDREPKNVLDVGCASGWFLSEIHKVYPDAKYHGVDKYKSAVGFGNKEYKYLSLKYADAHQLPYKASSFDLVICTEVLEHVEDPDVVLREIKRILKPKGRAVIEMDSGNLLFKAAWYWWTNIRDGVWKDSHIHVFNIEKLEKIILKSGLTLKKRKIFNFTMGVAFLLERK